MAALWEWKYVVFQDNLQQDAQTINLAASAATGFLLLLGTVLTLLGKEKL